MYRTPEPDDVYNPTAIASTLDGLRVWQVRKLVPLLASIPVHVNHRVNTTLLDKVPVLTQRVYNVYIAWRGGRPVAAASH